MTISSRNIPRITDHLDEIGRQIPKDDVKATLASLTGFPSNLSLLSYLGYLTSPVNKHIAILFHEIRWKPLFLTQPGDRLFLRRLFLK